MKKSTKNCKKYQKLKKGTKNRKKHKKLKKSTKNWKTVLKTEQQYQTFPKIVKDYQKSTIRKEISRSKQSPHILFWDPLFEQIGRALAFRELLEQAESLENENIFSEFSGSAIPFQLNNDIPPPIGGTENSRNMHPVFMRRFSREDSDNSNGVGNGRHIGVGNVSEIVFNDEEFLEQSIGTKNRSQR